MLDHFQTLMKSIFRYIYIHIYNNFEIQVHCTDPVLHISIFIYLFHFFSHYFLLMIIWKPLKLFPIVIKLSYIKTIAEISRSDIHYYIFFHFFFSILVSHIKSYLCLKKYYDI